MNHIAAFLANMNVANDNTIYDKLSLLQNDVGYAEYNLVVEKIHIYVDEWIKTYGPLLDDITIENLVNANVPMVMAEKNRNSFWAMISNKDNILTYMTILHKNIFTNIAPIKATMLFIAAQGAALTDLGQSPDNEGMMTYADYVTIIEKHHALWLFPVICYVLQESRFRMSAEKRNR